jgi:RND family efflux transporter MFP subunit
MKKKLLILGIIIVMIGGAAFVVMMKQKGIATLAKPQARVTAIGTAEVVEGQLEITTHYMGTIEPYTRSELSARISGNILSIFKREGDNVRQGELLAEIDSREIEDRARAAHAEVLASQQRLAGAKSTYEMQKSVYERDAILYPAGAISREALERSQSLYEGAKSSMNAFQENLEGQKKNASAAQVQAGYAKILAPFSGVVTKRWSEPGDLAVPGKPILTIEKTSSYKVTAQIPQEELRHLRKGAKVYLRNADQSLTASVSRVYPALSKNLLATIEVNFATSPFGLPSGSTVGMDLVRDGVSGFIIPENALVKTDRGTFVYALDNGVVRIREVKVLGTGNGKSAVAGKLVAGELVAVGQENRLLGLADSSRVNPVKGKP